MSLCPAWLTAGPPSPAVCLPGLTAPAQGQGRDASTPGPFSAAAPAASLRRRAGLLAGLRSGRIGRRPEHDPPTVSPRLSFGCGGGGGTAPFTAVPFLL